MDSQSPIEVYDFLTKTTSYVDIKAKDGIDGGHGGGDKGIIDSLYDYVNGIYTGKALSDISVSVENHMAVFAAEKARNELSVVDIAEYIKELKSHSL